MLTLGLTGGLGSGKSTVSRILRLRGARVLDADAIVHDLYRAGNIPQEIARRFGEKCLSPDGSVNRQTLGAVVFSDPVKRLELEALVHPAVQATIVAALEDWKRGGFGGIAVVDVPLLVESSFSYPVDLLLLVEAQESIRLARLEARGLQAEEARRRIAVQATDAQRRARATHVIQNDGTLGELAEALNGVLATLGRDTLRRIP